MKLGLFGSIHSAEEMKQFGLEDNMVMELFDRFKPDIICGEVRREDYEQNREYQGPSEYRRFIFPYCKERDPVRPLQSILGFRRGVRPKNGKD